MDKELKPYADYITWRFEFNVFDLDKDEEGADNELTPL